MSRFAGAPIPPPPVLLSLAYSAIAISISGWIAAQFSDDRTTEPWQFTAAYVHGDAASTFAVIFALSAVINAILVTRRFRDKPRAHRVTGYPAWQAMVVLLGSGWATTVALTITTSWLEVILGAGIAVASVGACVNAALRDPESDQRASTRRAAQVRGRTDTRSRVMRGLRLGVPIALAVAALGAFVIGQTEVVVHRGCHVVGTGNVNGALSISTSDCGDFAVAPALTTADVQGAYGGEVDLVTQGYALGLPPVPIVTAIER